MVYPKKETDIQIGLRIKRSRHLMKMTQEKLAESIDVSVQYVSDLERGKVGASLSTIIKISNALHVSCDYLLLGQETCVEIASITNILSSLNSKQIKLVHAILLLLLQAFKM